MSARFEKILAILLFLAIIASAFFAINLKPKERYTEFFILNENGKAGDYPKKLAPQQNSTIIAGIVNHEQKTINYYLLVELDKEKVMEKTFDLGDGEKIMQNITFNTTREGNQKLELKLYKNMSSSPYSLHIYLEVKP